MMFSRCKRVGELRVLFIVPQRRGYSRSSRADSLTNRCWRDRHAALTVYFIYIYLSFQVVSSSVAYECQQQSIIHNFSTCRSATKHSKPQNSSSVYYERHDRVRFEEKLQQRVSDKRIQSRLEYSCSYLYSAVANR